MADSNQSLSATTAGSTGGYVLVLIGALCFAGNNAFAVVSYEGGANPLTLITVRMAAALVALALFLRLTGTPIPLPPRERNSALALGILNGAMAFCLISSFDHVAIALAILVFYLYPMLTGIGAWLLGQERLGRGLVVGLIGGFAGLVLALEVRGDVSGAFGTGVGLALAAALLMACVALYGVRVMRTSNTRSVIFHMHVSAVTLFAVASLVYGDWAMPSTTRGWIGFAANAACYTVAIVAFFTGMARIGAVRSSLLMNLEPVASIGFGFLLLGQVLDARQLAGAALVILSVTAVKWLGGARH
jgi:drug/metabolite transporter (DMT)-like permease